MSTESVCNICKEASHLRCSNCLVTYYCSKTHQKLDWKSHKLNCISFKIEVNEELGRHMVATRFISEGEVIIKENPLIDGPPQMTPPICLGCYNLIDELNKRDCSKCGWPVCSETCEKLDTHRPECEITAQRKNGKVKINTFVQGYFHPSYQCLTVLRCLYLKKKKPLIWKKIMNLESHCEERKNTIKNNSDQIFITKFIPEFFNFTDSTNEEILKVTGIVQVNAHEVPLKKPGYIAIYEKASYLEHNCRANCIKSFTNLGSLVIRAAEKINPGDHLSICYTDPLWGRSARLQHLMETKFFLCRCLRCLDPTEFGTHFNSIKCRNNCSGYSIPSIDKDEIKMCRENYRNCIWKCQICKNISMEENSILVKVNQSLDQLDKKNVKSCLNFLNKYEKVLHPNHHLLIAVKLNLIDLLAWQDKLPVIDDQNLNWIIKTCREIYVLIESLIPAEHRLLGIILYQLQLALMEDGRRKVTCDSNQIRLNLVECQNVLKQVHKFLKHEPDELPEGKMAIEAEKALKNIEELL